MAQSRKLAAIMFADIVGYTAMMQEDETIAIACRQKLKQSLDEIVPSHGGKMIEFRGDGALCSFNSTMEGVKAAIELQVSMQAQPKVPLRIGMHTGDVIMEGNNLYGDVVNIASRMESFALPGSILISGKAYDDIKNQKEIQTVPLGKYALKNVKEEVEIYAISNPGIKIPVNDGLEGKGEKVSQKRVVAKSIAVLPFVNMSSDNEQEYFSDGITEEIINSLAHIKDLKVAGRTSSFFFKNKNIDLRLIGEQLEVRNVLEGSVRKQGDRLRITAQLISVEDGFHVWSEHFDRKLDDIFAIQDEIAMAITEKLKITLLEKEKAGMQKKPTEQTLAYDLYLKGRFYLNKRGPGLIKGLEYFRKALEVDPTLALAYSGIADAYSILAFYGSFPPHEAMPKARRNAEKAIQLDPSNVEGYTTLAFICVFYDWNWPEAKERFRRIFEINPNYATAHYWYSYYLSFVENKFEEGIEEARKAAEQIEPMVSISHHVLAMTYLNAGKYEEALEAAEMSVELDANSFLGHRVKGLSLAMLKRYDEAVEALNMSITVSSRHTWPLVELCWVYSLMGKETEGQKIMDELMERSKREFTSGLFLCGAAYFTRNYDKALEYLELAFEQRDGTLPCIKAYPLSSFIRTDPRFQPYLERMKFPETSVPELQK